MLAGDSSARIMKLCLQMHHLVATSIHNECRVHTFLALPAAAEHSKLPCSFVNVSGQVG